MRNSQCETRQSIYIWNFKFLIISNFHRYQKLNVGVIGKQRHTIKCKTEKPKVIKFPKMSLFQNIQLQNFAQVAGLALVADELEEEEPKEKKKRLWVRNWIARRPIEVPLFQEVQVEDREKFFSDFRFYPEGFQILLER